VRALITGATGFIGRRLCAALVARGDRVAVLARDPERARRALGDVEAHRWDAESESPPPSEALASTEVVFHLVGEPVAAGRWSEPRKARIHGSRVLGTRRLVGALATHPPKVLVSASAIGFYGSRGDQLLDEQSAGGDDFLAHLCREWEEEALGARARGVRVALSRIGVVLGPGGGALAQMLPPFRLGVGGRLGDGRQWMSWVHLDDAVGLLLHAADDARVDGPLNVVAPAPVTNAEFTRALGRVLHRPAVLPVPRAALRLVFGELAGVLLASQRVAPRVAEATGYRFRHVEVEAALAAILG
jgi:uncharacterized protein (TIGR01777 family)